MSKDTTQHGAAAVSGAKKEPTTAARKRLAAALAEVLENPCTPVSLYNHTADFVCDIQTRLHSDGVERIDEALAAMQCGHAAEPPESYQEVTAPKPLTLRQVELLIDEVLVNSSHEGAVTNPLLLLMADFQENCRDSSQVEYVAATIIRRCYAGTGHADEQEDVYIEQLREQRAKALGSAE